MEKHFFINSNICFPDEELNFDKFIYNISGNTGNSYITYSIIKALYGKFQKVDDIKNLWFYRATQKDIDKINNEYSKVILVLQDNIRLFDSYLNHDIYEGLVYFFKKIKIPIVVFSLGSNSFDRNWQALQDGLNKNLVSLLKIISDNTVSFGVRGEYTLDILNKLGIKNAEVVGCPSYFETGKNRVVQKPKLKTDFRVLAGGHFEHINSRDINCVLQDEALFIKAIAFENERLLVNDFRNVNINDGHQKSILKAYLENRIAVFSDMEKWKEFNKDFDFYVGSRVHGAIMAINAGLPAIVTNGDSRAEEMCNLFGITINTSIASNCDLRELYESIDVEPLNQRYNSLYNNYLKWLNNNGLELNYFDCNKQQNNLSNINGNCFGDYKVNSEINDAYLRQCQILAEQQITINNINKNVVIENISYSKTKPRFAKYIARFCSAFIIGTEKRKKVRKYIIDKFSNK